ncbi:hypothetical protein JTE90_014974 [Oedothorax gibbosus]|uniref:Uncharacterized protein n=1 Tax=Oedothorax gibbosus TaxID=931172 RepID=A0AAV6UWZ4_9ARAC|nr:hypothetical protein JTE90_014974 [Oedothorax gibbosus]
MCADLFVNVTDKTVTNSGVSRCVCNDEDVSNLLLSQVGAELICVSSVECSESRRRVYSTSGGRVEKNNLRQSEFGGRFPERPREPPLFRTGASRRYARPHHDES